MIRKHVYISFIPNSGSFTVRAKGSKEIIAISHIYNKWGLVCELDLYVGATLKILDRSLTLRQVSAGLGKRRKGGQAIESKSGGKENVQQSTCPNVYARYDGTG